MNHGAPLLPSTGTAAWKGAFGTAGGVLLGGVLLVAAWAKLIHPEAFVEQIELEGLDFLLPARAVAFFALGLEVALGLALVLGLRRLWVLAPSSLLVAFFLFLTGRNYWLTAHGLRDAGESCGCFGNLVERTPAEAFWQDVILLVPPLVLAFLARGWGSRRAVGVRLAAVVVLTAAALGFAWKAPELSLDDLATRLKPGTRVGDVCAGSGGDRVCLDLVAPELLEGRQVVVIADLEDEAFGEAVAGLNDYALAAPAAPLWVLTAAPPEVQKTFYWKWGPAFEVREAPQPMLAPLVRRLPRSFLLEDGTVSATSAGLPPLERWSEEPGS